MSEREAIDWAGLDLPEIVHAYWRVVAPARRADGYDPRTERPTYDWLHENGFRALTYALERYHDRSVSEFWKRDLGLPDSPRAYDWGIDHQPTVEALESFLDSRRKRGDLSESSVDTLRYRLAKYVRAYRDVNGSDDLVTPVARGSDAPPYAAVDRCWETFDHLHAEIDSGTTKRRIYGAVDGWYSHLVRRKRAAINPVADLDEEFAWSTEHANNPPLNAEHVRALFDAGTSAKERLLVVALCGWGLRSSEVAALHASQFRRDDDREPYVNFETRKNGPGEVAVFFGEELFEERIDELSERGGWNGYLFPSSTSRSGHISRQTVLNWFDDLAGRAGLPSTIDGQKPVPQMGRRFWYDSYSTTMERILEEVEEIAADQGSSTGEVVLRNYLSEERLRKLRRAQMREKLSSAFSV